MDLRVSSVSFTSRVNAPAKSNSVSQKESKVVTSPLAQPKKDVFEKKPFSVDEAIETNKQLKFDYNKV